MILTVPSHGIIEAVGVGYILLPTTVSRFGNLFSFHADSGVIVAAIAEQLLGVGHISWRFFNAFRLLLPPSIPEQFGV
jgi:hypothetical protein